METTKNVFLTFQQPCAAILKRVMQGLRICMGGILFLWSKIYFYIKINIFLFLFQRQQIWIWVRWMWWSLSFLWKGIIRTGKVLCISKIIWKVQKGFRFLYLSMLMMLNIQLVWVNVILAKLIPQQCCEQLSP